MAGLFDKQAEIYSDSRPTYPSEWFSKLAALTSQRSLAWDAGTGNGQAALALFLLFGAVLFDGVWKLRNQVIFENTSLSIEDLSSRIGRLLAEFQNSRAAEAVPVRPAKRLLVWSPPRRFSFKINVDAAIGPLFSSIAAVARDWRGRLVFACSQKVNTTFPLQAEAEAVRWALVLAAKLEAVSVFIESDSKICCDALVNPCQTSPWRIRSIVMEMQVLLFDSSHVFVSWVTRSANMAAHLLAKWSLSCNLFGSFDLGRCPPIFASVVERDCGN
ncbi:uncharacterized protein LOC112008563 [Quercus suber]|uniref:uncharacterized protein LOC112008563 n=1 Tax=Quercus suber TaxID=58331 RepID=UPI0032DE681B